MKLATQLLLGYGTVLGLMILTAGVSYESSRWLLRTQKMVEEGREITAAARLFQKSMVDMQTAIRGYLIVGEEHYLYPYEQGREAYEKQMDRLNSLVQDDARQLERLNAIEALVKQWLATVAVPEIEQRRKVARGELELSAVAERIGQEDAGRTIFTEIRDRTNAFLDVEQEMLDEAKDAAAWAFRRDMYAVIGFNALAILLGLGAARVITGSVLRKVGGEPSDIAAVTEQIAQGHMDVEIESGTGIRGSVATMLEALRENRTRTEQQDWLKTGIARLNEATSGDPEIEELGSKVVAEMSAYLDAQLGAIYVARERGKGPLSLTGTYACPDQAEMPCTFELGQGLIGQAALERRQILIDEVPGDYVRVTSGLGDRVPASICVTPFAHQHRLKGVVELGLLGQVSQLQKEYLQHAMPVLGVAVESAQSRARLASALEESQRLTEELQTQQEELKAINEELEQQTQRLEESENRLKVQQEELEVTNEELEEKNGILERQKEELERGRKNLATKAEELALASKYKSEFLANMSHELRTPLNSLLLLSQDLAGNKPGNLTEQQVESAHIIHRSGKDLLNLINDVLDLSKIEAGRLDVQMGTVAIHELAESVHASFDHIARDKGLSLDVTISEDAPAKITSDRRRIEQILKNLVSNAIKFTEQGGVAVLFNRPKDDSELPNKELTADRCVAMSIRDTGIGIDPEKQKLIFEAFQQADGGTARKYGGTGLGLSISRELIHLLGGEMNVESTPDKGSTFTLYLPLEVRSGRTAASSVKRVKRRSESSSRRIAQPPSARPEPVAVKIDDDRDRLEKEDRVVLIVEDDPTFARLLRNKCHENGFKCLVASSGESGLEMVADRLPTAVVLDVRLPGMDGWTVLSMLKEDTRTRHVPVHVVSVDERSAESLQKGAIGHAVKPLDQERLDEVFQKLQQASDEKPKRVLVVEDHESIRQATVRLLSTGDVTAEEAKTGAEAFEMLREGGYHCVVLDLRLPDMDGDQLLAALEKEGIELPPVVVHTGRDLTPDEEMALRDHAESIVIKDVRSQERLLDEVSLFLHCVVSKMPEKTQKIIRDLHDTDALLRGKKIMVVDDDMRTTFAMSHLLSSHGMETLKAENGERALRLLTQHPDVQLVLMDIMMPVMDGYQAMKRIRMQEQFRDLPIIVLTAKAMPEDREKCLEAGANDYLPKPVDQQRLMSMLRVWLQR